MTTSLGPQFKLFAHSPDGTVQAPLFASPREIMQSKPVLGDTLPESAWRVDPKNVAADGYETFASIQNRKLDESKDRLVSRSATLYDSVRDEGVKAPLFVSAMPPHPLDEPEAGEHLMVMDGHHRLFSALESRPDEHILLEHNTDEDRDTRFGNMGKPRRYPGQKE